MLCNEGGPHATAADVEGHDEVDDGGANRVVVPVAREKRHDLGVYLAAQHVLPM